MTSKRRSNKINLLSLSFVTKFTNYFSNISIAKCTVVDVVVRIVIVVVIVIVINPDHNINNCAFSY